MTPEQLVSGARQLEKRALAKLVSLFEREDPASVEHRAAVMAQLAEPGENANQPGLTVGLTGTPGVGKSSLVNALSLELIKQSSDINVAIVAVDPSSHITRGSLLGDRTRTRFPSNESRLYFRSQPTNLELGGITQKTFQAVRILRHFFSLVLVETVGIGQNELAVGDLADYTLLVVQPMGGDQIQFLKSGIMELPDGFVVNKCDETKLANETWNMLRSGLKSSAMISGSTATRDLFKTSTVTGEGIDTLAVHLRTLVGSGVSDHDFRRAENNLFQRWVKEEFGQFGHRQLANNNAWDGIQPFELRQKEFIATLEKHLKS